jgi:hypothetical protein
VLDSSDGKPPDELTSAPSGKRGLVLILLGDFLANVAANYTTRSTAPTLYVLGFLVFQLLFLLWEIVDLNAAHL